VVEGRGVPDGDGDAGADGEGDAEADRDGDADGEAEGVADAVALADSVGVGTRLVAPGAAAALLE
jgi:hypothetical protein